MVTLRTKFIALALLAGACAAPQRPSPQVASRPAREAEPSQAESERVEQCAAAQRARSEELERLSSCSSDAECGKPVATPGSCGCTRSAVVRLDADIARYTELLMEIDQLHRVVPGCTRLAEVCTCPQFDGFMCREGRCAWKPLDRSTTEISKPATQAAPPKPVELTRTPDGTLELFEGECPSLDTYLARLAGPGAIDCGTVALGQDPSTALQCARTAFTRGQALRVALMQRGKDSKLAVAWVRDEQGLIHAVRFDSDAGGGGQDRPTITRNVCEQPSLSDGDVDGSRPLFKCSALRQPRTQCAPYPPFASVSSGIPASAG